MPRKTIDNILITGGLVTASAFGLSACADNPPESPASGTPASAVDAAPAKTTYEKPEEKAESKYSLDEEGDKDLKEARDIVEDILGIKGAEVSPAVPEAKPAVKPVVEEPAPAPAVKPEAKPLVKPAAAVKKEAPSIIVPSSSVDLADFYSKMGVPKEWVAAETARGEKGNEKLGWDFYDPIELPWGNALGKDGFRFTLRGKGTLGTDLWKLSETAKLEWEPFKKYRGADGLRFILDFQNLNAGYGREDGSDLSVNQQRLGLGVRKYFEIGDDLQLLTGLRYDMKFWHSNGENAPDEIDSHMLAGELGLKIRPIRLSLFGRFGGSVDGSYELLGVENDLTSNDMFISLKYDSESGKWFAGAEYGRTDDDFDNARQTLDQRTTVFGGVNDLKYADLLAVGATWMEREDSISGNDGRFGAELRAGWQLGKDGWIRVDFGLREPEKDSDNSIDAYVGVGGGFSF